MRGMRVIARFMDARNTAEGKFLSVLLSVLLVFSFLNVTMFTDLANADDEVALGAAIEVVGETEDVAETPEEVTEPETPASETETESVLEEEAPEPDPADTPEPTDPSTDTDVDQPAPNDPTEEGSEAAPIMKAAAPAPNKDIETYASNPKTVSVGEEWTEIGRAHV